MDSAFIELTRVDLDADVEATLLSFTHDLLPDEITKSYLSDWILNFDSLRRGRFQSDRSKEETDDPIAALISTTVESSLSPNVTFYFGSLFHIGRQWQISTFALDSIESALRKNNLKETVSRNVDKFRATLSSLDVAKSNDERIVSTLLEEALGFAQKHHQQRIDVARGYWKLWQYEVQELIALVEKCSEEYNRYSYGRWNEGRPEFLSNSTLLSLARFSYRLKPLFRSFTDDGVQFKELSSTPDSLSNPLSTLLLPLMISALGDERMRYELRDLLHEFANLLHIQKEFSSSQDPAANLVVTNLLPLLISALNDEKMNHELRSLLREFAGVFQAQQEVLTARRIGPVTEDVQRKLLRLFKEQDPFVKYYGLKSPPDLELSELWTKCQLPNGEVFHYAKLWKDSLQRYTVSSYEPPRLKKRLDQTDVESFALSADCTIKSAWISSSKMQTGLTQNECIQQYFEKWIFEMVNAIFYAARNKEGEVKWTLSHFKDLVDRVVEFLKNYDYALESPSRVRLEALWEKASKSYIYDSTEW